VLAAASPGRAPSLWEELPAAAAAGALPPLLLVAGLEDPKFAGVAERLALLLVPVGSQGPVADAALLPGCGHAVHIERPLDLVAALQQFSERVTASGRPQQEQPAQQQRRA
jgi:isochorismate synthase/2-succinyl-5-enolpyruvyl-6-hydroxy-3-cyclohexene-1-carboxylate synthase/2-succinyl-6-hydroxy-2,4-cyclohexadiene-1-carboxylate synthase/O-succinylbenzoate synthase